MKRHFARAVLATLALVLIAVTHVSAEWQIKPFAGATYGGDTTYVLVQPQPHFVFGVGGLLLGEIFGVEGDFGHTSGFFQPLTTLATPLVVDSGVTTLTGNVVVAMPRRLTRYTLRPYAVGGAGMMHVSIDTQGGALPVSSTLKAMDLGAGVTGFLTRRVGVSWDVRYFRSIDRTVESGFSFTSEHLSFWRASMAVAVRL